MKTKRIILRNVTESDLHTLHSWRNSPKYRRLVHYSDTLIDMSNFLKEYKADRTARKYEFII